MGELNEVNHEESFRMKVWMENKAAIEKHNKEFEEVKINHKNRKVLHHF